MALSLSKVLKNRNSREKGLANLFSGFGCKLPGTVIG